MRRTYNSNSKYWASSRGAQPQDVLMFSNQVEILRVFLYKKRCFAKFQIYSWWGSGVKWTILIFMLITAKITQSAIAPTRVKRFRWNFAWLLYPNSTFKRNTHGVTLGVTLWDNNIFLKKMYFQCLNFLANKSRSKN